MRIPYLKRAAYWEGKMYAKGIEQGKLEAHRKKPLDDSLKSHIGKILDNMHMNPVDAAIAAACAYLGYDTTKNWQGALAGIVSYKLATTMGGTPPVSQIVGVIGLGTLGLANPGILNEIQNLLTGPGGAVQIAINAYQLPYIVSAHDAIQKLFVTKLVDAQKFVEVIENDAWWAGMSVDAFLAALDARFIGEDITANYWIAKQTVASGKDVPTYKPGPTQTGGSGGGGGTVTVTSAGYRIVTFGSYSNEVQVRDSTENIVFSSKSSTAYADAITWIKAH
jgi:hypothetical protein